MITSNHTQKHTNSDSILRDVYHNATVYLKTYNELSLENLVFEQWKMADNYCL